MKLCDLHTHTVASDGSDSPYELISLAKDIGLSAIAITDHDTTDGILEGKEAAREVGLEFIPGVELSVNYPYGNMHILGYFIDIEIPRFKNVLKRVQQARANRNPRIIEKLNQLGFSITIEELEEISQGGQIGRPHFARLMVEKGIVRSVEEAFEYYLKKGAKAYAPKSILEPKEAIDVIKEAKGVPVLAHPFSLQIKEEKKLKDAIKVLKEQGLLGIECYYSEHDKTFTDLCLNIAKELDLIVTGGSDYHGKAKPKIKLGIGKGNLQIPYSCVEALKAKANV